jgi:hypothetical protein
MMECAAVCPRCAETFLVPILCMGMNFRRLCLLLRPRCPVEDTSAKLEAEPPEWHSQSETGNEILRIILTHI